MSDKFKLINPNFECINLKYDLDGSLIEINKLGQDFLKQHDLSEKEFFNNLKSYRSFKETQIIEIDSLQYKLFVYQLEDKIIFSIEKYNNFISKDELQKMKLLSLGEMTSGIIHDIKNPVSMSLSSLELLRFSFDDLNLSEESMGDIEKLFSSLEMGISRINDIIDGVSMFLHKEQIEFKEVQLESFMQKTLSFLKYEIEKRNAKVKLDKSLKNITLNAKNSLLSQVIVNMIKNSLDELEKMEFHQKWIEISYQDDKNYHIIKIQDGGMGIPLDVQKNIFEPFFTTKEVGKGTGLGLSLCKTILEIHKGTLEIDNSEKNTTFLLKLNKNI